MIKNTFRALVLALAAACGFSANAANDYGLPENIQDGNILHLFCWNASQITQELPNIAAAGFTAIQLSPIQGNAASGSEWFYAYLPYDIKMRATGTLSNVNQLKNLCAAADEYGIKVIVDVVANHVNKASGYHDKWWDENGRVRFNGKINYSNRTSITHNQLGDYGDINSEDAEVQARAKEYIQMLKDAGVAGIRWDAAKHIGLPSEDCAFWEVVTSVPGLYHYGEMLDGPGGNKYNLLEEYTQYMTVTDTEYSNTVFNAVKAGRVPSASGTWANNAKVDASKVLYWAESHDTYANETGASKNISQDKIDRAWAIGACRKGATSLYLARPLKSGYSEIKMGQKGSTHFADPEIAAVNHFRNAMGNTEEKYTAANNVACITRQGGGAVIVVGAGGSAVVSIANGNSYVPAGYYKDRVSGNIFTVTESTISGTTGPTGIAVIYGETTREAGLTLSPAGGNFDTETLEVSASLVNATSGWVKVDGGQTIEVGANGAKFTIGQGVAIDTDITVEWSATNAYGSQTGTVVYTKLDPNWNTGNQVVYFDNSVSKWAKVYAYCWDDSHTGNNAISGKWPGAELTKKVTINGKEMYEYSFDASYELKNCQIIFNNGGSSQTADLKFENNGIYTNQGIQGYNGIENVTVEDDDANAPVEYYTLQGVRVSEPSTAGIYIVRQGKKVSKQYIR